MFEAVGFEEFTMPVTAMIPRLVGTEGGGMFVPPPAEVIGISPTCPVNAPASMTIQQVVAPSGVMRNQAPLLFFPITRTASPASRATIRSFSSPGPL